ncbi:thioesterase II family protein [Micromonospora sp. CA-111912]|uniref:thioesterase II family protein n=1 Tax=Micromonospora sp. CA-111912 TaxID=3239955 RepID=UPI003D8D3540
MKRHRWLLRDPSDESVGRIFCFPYSGMGASMFNRWPRWIDGIEVCLVQLPGRENRIREPHYRSYPQLADVLAEQLLPLLDRPFVFFGHCAGALPAYETARRLPADRLALPAGLVVSAQVAPHHCPHDRFLALTDEELLDELAGLAVRRGGQPDPAMLALSLAVLREDLEANRHYRLDEPAPVPMPVTVLRWADDPEVTEAELRGWEHYGDDVRFDVLAGGHYEFLTAPEPLLALLSAQLQERAPR